jgi:hypothetical protein
MGGWTVTTLTSEGFRENKITKKTKMGKNITCENMIPLNIIKKT